VKGDLLSGDSSWDPVWDVATQVDSLGWTAEFRIPLSQLRFPPDTEQTWGVQVIRFVQRLNEQSQWAWWRQNEAGGVSRYGHLTGLALAGSPGRAELLPYVVGRSSHLTVRDAANPFTQPHAMDYRGGLDAKVLLTSNLTLSATVNPDFGQVEVDPAVVNLSAFETSFSERRPFFVEGAGYFRFGGLNCFSCSNASGLQMLYTRRMGRQPQGSGTAFASSRFADVPENTAILGAAKITGRTRAGWSIGVLDAVTRRERATILRADGTGGAVEVEPFTNYFVTRIARDLRGGNTQVRGIATSLVRDLGDPGLARLLNRHAEGAGLEADHWWGNRTYRLMATAAVSSIGGSPEAVLRSQLSSARYYQRPDRRNRLLDSSRTGLTGYALYTRLSKEGGDVQFEAQTNVRSPGFEVNDLSFITRADYLWFNGNVRWRNTRQTGWSRWVSAGVGGQQARNFEGEVTETQVHASAFVRLLNFWEVSVYGQRRFDKNDDRLTRGGPMVKRPAHWYFNPFVTSNPRKSLVVSAGPWFTRVDDGGGEFGGNINVTYRPAPNLSLSFNPNYSTSWSTAGYVTAVTDPTNAAFFGRRYVFAYLDQRTLSMDTRLNLTFTPTLTLELYAQPLIGSGRYSAFREFVAPRERQQRIYGQDGGTISRTGSTLAVDPDGGGPAAPFTFTDPSFNIRSLRGNAVLRWEYRPGSTLYFVWTQSRSSSAAFGDLDVSRDLDALLGAPSDNIFLLKVSYWLGL
jgi:hypothetical protein